MFAHVNHRNGVGLVFQNAVVLADGTGAATGSSRSATTSPRLANNGLTPRALVSTWARENFGRAWRSPSTAWR
jgi:hypothetical protein